MPSFFFFFLSRINIVRVFKLEAIRVALFQTCTRVRLVGLRPAVGEDFGSVNLLPRAAVLLMLLLCSRRSVLLSSPCRGQDPRGPHPSPGLRCGVSHTHCSHREDVAQQACPPGNHDAGCRVRTSGLKGAVALINFLQ